MPPPFSCNASLPPSQLQMPRERRCLFVLSATPPSASEKWLPPPTHSWRPREGTAPPTQDSKLLGWVEPAADQPLPRLGVVQNPRLSGSLAPAQVTRVIKMNQSQMATFSLQIIPYKLHCFCPEPYGVPYGPWSTVVDYIGNRVPFWDATTDSHQLVLHWDLSCTVMEVLRMLRCVCVCWIV